MNKSMLPEIKNAFSKFRVLGGEDLKEVLDGRLKRSQLNYYRHLLWKNKLIKRRAHPWAMADAYEATSALLDESLIRMPSRKVHDKDDELEHRLGCTRIMIELCKRSFVSGVALEHELLPADLVHFCHKRIPDGIVQISKPGKDSCELGVELEWSRKSIVRVDEIFAEYQISLESAKYQCKGILIVAPSEPVFDLYTSKLEKLPGWFQNWIILSKRLDLSDVSKSILGERLNSVHQNTSKPAAKRRLIADNKVKYLNDLKHQPSIKGAYRRSRSAEHTPLEF